MQNFRKILRNLGMPSKNELRDIVISFSRRERRVFSVLVIVLIVSTIGILGKLNNSFMVGVPIQGGSIREGIIGTPRFINPALAISDTDKDLTSLIYSGLMRKGADGKLIPDLAEGYEVSEDGATFTFLLKENIYFHDGEPVTVEDIIFTINTIKDPLNKSPKKSNWDGVDVEKVDDRTIVFSLKGAYSSFLDNTTLGILPLHLWENSPIELNEANINPTGSGPFMIDSFNKESSGIIDQYELKAFKKFSLGTPYIKRITLKFYPNENDLLTGLKDGEIDQISSITPENAETLKEKGYKIESAVLPRVFGLFFNQSQNQIFTDKSVIKAMDQAIDKNRIIREVLKGYGIPIEDPIPNSIVSFEKLSGGISTREENLKKAEETLTKGGWQKNTEGILEKTTTDSKKKKTTSRIEFSISTGNAPELVKSAELIQEDLRALGMIVDIKTFESGNLSQVVIRPRKYDALLFGEIINHESDLFAFWHSSQRKDPGLNVAMYTNAKVDKILEDAFVTVKEEDRVKKYLQFQDEIRKDMPAVFVYSPSFIYAVSPELNNLSIENITSPGDRFLNSYLWYTKTDKVWKIFSK
ncbi:MAG: ABC transporter substrate-binding protein [Candidatus Pacebacteria bacterium]|nr:ABC transporter substrate-binding protein [Candidatus Paceibacterota bacterium]MBP9839673.1 ABC transporter substrate-binding protein [Candidatus Paceibacterota bacterium]